MNPNNIETIFSNAGQRYWAAHLIVSGFPIHGEGKVGAFEVTFQPREGAKECRVYSAIAQQGLMPTPSLLVDLIKASGSNSHVQKKDEGLGHACHGKVSNKRKGFVRCTVRNGMSLERMYNVVVGLSSFSAVDSEGRPQSRDINR